MVQQGRNSAFVESVSDLAFLKKDFNTKETWLIAKLSVSSSPVSGEINVKIAHIGCMDHGLHACTFSTQGIQSEPACNEQWAKPFSCGNRLWQTEDNGQNKPPPSRPLSQSPILNLCDQFGCLWNRMSDANIHMTQIGWLAILYGSKLEVIDCLGRWNMLW